MKVIAKPHEFFNINRSFLEHLISGIFGTLLFLRLGAVAAVRIVPKNQGFITYLIVNLLISFLLYTFLAFSMSIISKRFGGDVNFHDMHANLGFIGVPRTVFALFFYVSVLMLNERILNKEMLWLAIFLFVTSITSKVWELILTFICIHKVTGISYKKSLFVVIIFTVLTAVLSNLMSVKGISHPYLDVIIRNIDFGSV